MGNEPAEQPAWVDPRNPSTQAAWGRESEFPRLCSEPNCELSFATMLVRTVDAVSGNQRRQVALSVPADPPPKQQTI